MRKLPAGRGDFDIGAQFLIEVVVFYIHLPKHVLLHVFCYSARIGIFIVHRKNFCRGIAVHNGIGDRADPVLCAAWTQCHCYPGAAAVAGICAKILAAVGPSRTAKAGKD